MPNEIVTMTPSEFKELKHSEMLMAVGFDALSDVTGNSLEHHQRKGAKWGVRNGPPYPLNADGNRKFEAMVSKNKKSDGKVRPTNGDVKKAKANPPKMVVGGLKHPTNSKSDSEKPDNEKKKFKIKTPKDIVEHYKEQRRLEDEWFEAQVRPLYEEQEERAKKEEAERIKREAEDRKKDMMDAVRSGDYERIQKYFSELTPDQISEAITRMDLQRTLKRYDPTPKEKPQKPQQEPSEWEEFVKRRNEDAVADADWKYAKRHFDRLSENDLEKLIKRIDYRQQIDPKFDKKFDNRARTMMDRIDSTVKKLDKINGWAEKGIKWWNTAAKINNAFNENKMPMIDTQITTKFNKPANLFSTNTAKANETFDKILNDIKEGKNQKGGNKGGNGGNGGNKGGSTSSTSTTTSSGGYKEDYQRKVNDWANEKETAENYKKNVEKLEKDAVERRKKEEEENSKKNEAAKDLNERSKKHKK